MVFIKAETAQYIASKKVNQNADRIEVNPFSFRFQSSRYFVVVVVFSF
jgi:hypothetical protein